MAPPAFKGALTDSTRLSLSFSSLSEESKLSLSLRVFSAVLPPRDVPELMLPACKKGSATCGQVRKGASMCSGMGGSISHSQVA